MSAITVVDYGMGNLHSVRRKLAQIGADAVVSGDPAAVARADKLVLPGVGHFAQAMRNLGTTGLGEALGEAVRRRGAPILGICLGMQLFAQRSEEGEVAGLGWMDADVVRFRVSDTLRHKVPHMGWNQVVPAAPSPLFSDMEPGAELYFVHSYHFECRDPSLAIGRTEYAYPFVSAVQKDHIFGVQFHPEKSHAAGERLLRRFVER
jgi:glutamine amidotransferase